MTGAEDEGRPGAGVMRAFVTDNRDELIARCAAKAARRAGADASQDRMANGIPIFIEQLARALEAEGAGQLGESLEISGGPNGDAGLRSEIGSSAAAHGADLMRLGFDIDSVVHCYGDLCQSVTDLAVERQAPFSVEDFRTLNRCLDNAIADAATGFGAMRDAGIARNRTADESRRLGSLAHELRNALHTATLAFSALEAGALPVAGSTGSVVSRSHAAMAALLDTALGEARAGAPKPGEETSFQVADLFADIAEGAALDARGRGCELEVAPVPPDLWIAGDRALLTAAVSNVLGNALKFTHRGTSVYIGARLDGDRLLIEVSDHCGGLPHGAAAKLFKPFSQAGGDRSGLGLGLTIARASVEADGGQIGARDMPGIGCVFSIHLPRRGAP